MSGLTGGPSGFGVQFAAFIGILAITQPPVGSAGDRYGRRRFIIEKWPEASD